MNPEKIEPVYFEIPSRGEKTWVYPWIGIGLGVAVGILIGHPFAMLAYNLHACLISGTTCDVTGALFHSFQWHMWPMMLLFAVFGGVSWGIIGLVLKYLRENRLRLDTLHQEFEFQVATLRHHYKNLAIGIHGFSGRIKRKMGNIEEQVQECARDCPTYKSFHEDFESLARNVDVLEEAAQRLTQTLGQELLFLKALTSDTLNPTPQDFYRLLTHCIQDLKDLRFREKEIRFAINGNPLEELCPTGLVFPFEPYTMEVILQNILANAMRYGDFIQIQILESHNRVRVEVQDNGPGLEVEKLQQRILIPKDKGAESTHLGLGVTMHLLTKTGGRLSAWSEPGAGATFIVEFPK
jgi:signal transduction histidine kinase